MSLFSDIKAGINSLLNEGDVDYDEDNFENAALDAMKKGTSSKDAAALLVTWRSSNNFAKELEKSQENGIGFFQKDLLISAKSWIDKIFKQIKIRNGSFFRDIKFSYPSTENDSNVKKSEIKNGNKNIEIESVEDKFVSKPERTLDDEL